MSKSGLNYQNSIENVLLTIFRSRIRSRTGILHQIRAFFDAKKSEIVIVLDFDPKNLFGLCRKTVGKGQVKRHLQFSPSKVVRPGGFLSEFRPLGFYIDGTVNVVSLPAPVWAESPVRMVAKNASVLKRGFA